VRWPLVWRTTLDELIAKTQENVDAIEVDFKILQVELTAETQKAALATAWATERDIQIKRVNEEIKAQCARNIVLQDKVAALDRQIRVRDERIDFLQKATTKPNETVMEALGTMIVFCRHYVETCKDWADDRDVMQLKQKVGVPSIFIRMGMMRRLVELADLFGNGAKAPDGEPAGGNAGPKGPQTPKERRRTASTRPG